MKYQIKRKYENGQNWYYPMHSRFGLIYSYFKKDTGITYRVISPFGGPSDIPLKEKVKFDNLEDAKAFIGEKILNKMTETQREEVIYKILEEDYIKNEDKCKMYNFT